MKFQSKILGSVVGLGLLAMIAASVPAQAVTVVGNSGSITGTDGVVTPAPGFPTYTWISTNGGVNGGGQISGVGGTNGSSWQSDPFTANGGDKLQFFFNYVTSDGSGFADYGWAALLDSSLNTVGYLFTARTTPSGNISPGFGLPANISTLTPASTAVIPGGPVWSPLGGSSGACFSTGCGYTGWIQSDYVIGTTGTYSLIFGVSNFIDQAFDSGLAFAGATIGGHPISPVPLPAALPLFLAGLGGLGALRRRKSH